MALALDQTAALVYKDGTAGTTLGISFGTLPAVGSLIVVPIAIFDSNAVESSYVNVVDNQGNGTYNVITQGDDSLVGCNVQAHLAYVIATTSSGTFSVTLTISTPNTANCFVTMGAVSFIDITSVTVDKSNKVAQNGNPTTLNISTAETTSANELVMALISASANDANMNLTQNASGYSNLFLENDGATHQCLRCDYKFVSATGVQNMDFSHDTATSGNAGIIATWAGTAASATAPMFRGS
jgi:hypothetical protein